MAATLLEQTNSQLIINTITLPSGIYQHEKGTQYMGNIYHVGDYFYIKTYPFYELYAKNATNIFLAGYPLICI